MKIFLYSCKIYFYNDSLACVKEMTNMRYIFEEVDDKFIDIGANIDLQLDNI